MTKRVVLMYTVTQSEVIPPPQKERDRLNKFYDQVKRSVKADYEAKYMKVTHEVINPEVENLRSFFHTCVKYYAIQNEGLTEREPTTEEFQQYREEILDELLGYDYQTVNKVIRKRPSTSDYKDTQPWLTLLGEMEETIFAQAGYDFPDSKRFWELTKQYGYTKANDISIKQLQEKLKRRQ